MLKSDEFLESDQYFSRYQTSILKVKKFLDVLYFEFISAVKVMYGAQNFKLFLHVLYEIESVIYYMKDLFLSESDRLSDVLKREVKEKRRFEKVYYEYNLNL